MSTIWTGQHYFLTFNEPHHLAIHDLQQREAGASFTASKIIRSIVRVQLLNTHGESIVQWVKAIDDRHHADDWQLKALFPHERDVYLMHNDIAYARAVNSYMNINTFLNDLHTLATSTTPIGQQPHQMAVVHPHAVISRLQDFGQRLNREAPTESRLPFGR